MWTLEGMWLGRETHLHHDERCEEANLTEAKGGSNKVVGTLAVWPLHHDDGMVAERNQQSDHALQH